MSYCSVHTKITYKLLLIKSNIIITLFDIPNLYENSQTNILNKLAMLFELEVYSLFVSILL